MALDGVVAAVVVRQQQPFGGDELPGAAAVEEHDGILHRGLVDRIDVFGREPETFCTHVVDAFGDEAREPHALVGRGGPETEEGEKGSVRCVSSIEKLIQFGVYFLDGKSHDVVERAFDALDGGVADPLLNAVCPGFVEGLEGIDIVLISSSSRTRNQTFVRASKECIRSAVRKVTPETTVCRRPESRKSISTASSRSRGLPRTRRRAPRPCRPSAECRCGERPGIDLAFELREVDGNLFGGHVRGIELFAVVFGRELVGEARSRS